MMKVRLCGRGGSMDRVNGIMNHECFALTVRYSIFIRTYVSRPAKLPLSLSADGSRETTNL